MRSKEEIIEKIKELEKEYDETCEARYGCIVGGKINALRWVLDKDLVAYEDSPDST